MPVWACLCLRNGSCTLRAPVKVSPVCGAEWRCAKRPWVSLCTPGHGSEFQAHLLALFFSPNFLISCFLLAPLRIEAVFSTQSNAEILCCYSACQGTLPRKDFKVLFLAFFFFLVETIADRIEVAVGGWGGWGGRWNGSHQFGNSLWAKELPLAYESVWESLSLCLLERRCAVNLTQAGTIYGSSLL